MPPKRIVCEVCPDESCAKCRQRACSRRCGKAWAARNKEYLREKSKLWHRANPEKAKAKTLKWRAKNPQRQGEYDRKRLSGHTPEYFKAKLEEQRGLCAIGGEVLDLTRQRYVTADHDHALKKPRGILCARCNILVGWIENNPTLCEAKGPALAYLKQYEAINNPVAAE